MTLTEFVAKWTTASLRERAAAQEHMVDLCLLVEHATPAQFDPSGTLFTFEKGVEKTGGGSGFADVWYKDHFAWEYKGPGGNLKSAYQQLQKYRENLANPPLLVVSDLNRFEVHTNFTGTIKDVYTFDLADLSANRATGACKLPPLEVLRCLFYDPSRLRPEHTTAQVTEAAAREFSKIAESLRSRGGNPHQQAHFLIRLLFCLFAEDVGLLPESLFTKLAETTRNQPAEFRKRLTLLLDQMVTGGSFGPYDIEHFNGGLFDSDETFELTTADIAVLRAACKLDWSNIEPSILGTLFERSLDPGKRSQLGAHYTSREDILLIVEPVLMAPLRREWADVMENAQAVIDERKAVLARFVPGVKTAKADRDQADRLLAQLSDMLQGFAERLASVKVLDPACGSGNFLYVALRELLNLEKEVIAIGAANELTSFFPRVSPEQMRGIELNEYAHELASVTVWIGYIQWMRENGFGYDRHPVLRKIENIVHMDALMRVDMDGTTTLPDWPEADIVIGNPPFLGDKKMRSELGDEYVDRLRGLYEGSVPGGADFVTYWFIRAQKLIAEGRAKRAGLLATNSIRFGANRTVLEQIKATGDIFMAWRDRPWVLDGASVRVSMIGFDNGDELTKSVDGSPSLVINTDLTGSIDVTSAVALPENAALCFLGMMKSGPFDLEVDAAHAMIIAPPNPNGRSNTDVIKLRVGGQDVTGRPRKGWVVDFGVSMSEEEAAIYEKPFEYVKRVVKPIRHENRVAGQRDRWWMLARPRPALRSAAAGLSRVIATPEVAKHRLFAWIDADTVPDHTLHVIARADDYFFGVLQSRPHELWSLAQGNTLEDRPRYTATSTFETFPFPWPPGTEPTGDALVEAIATAARELVALRDAWLNPPGATDAVLKARTLTNLYNERPTFLANAHRKLDEAVFAAYGWPTDLADGEILARLLALNAQRAG